MQYRPSPFHRSSEREADVGRATRISDFIRDARADRDTLQMQSMQLPLGLSLPPAPGPIPVLRPVPVAVPVSKISETVSPGIRAYDPALLANTLIDQALEAIEQLGRLMTVNDEREKQLHLYSDAGAHASGGKPSLDGAARSVVDVCLVSASALLGMTRALYNRLPDPTPQERVQEARDLTELTKTAGRAAYRAALLIVDPEFQRAPRPASHRPEKAQL